VFAHSGIEHNSILSTRRANQERSQGAGKKEKTECGATITGEEEREKGRKGHSASTLVINGKREGRGRSVQQKRKKRKGR